MRISFQRTGGFTGMHPTVTLDTTSLSPPEERELRARVAEADPFHMEAKMGDWATRTDQFVYRLTIDETGETHTLVIEESEVPPRLRPLLDWLMAMARKGRNSNKTMA